jgi:hypothetical protein
MRIEMSCLVIIGLASRFNSTCNYSGGSCFPIWNDFLIRLL